MNIFNIYCIILFLGFCGLFIKGLKQIKFVDANNFLLNAEV